MTPTNGIPISNEGVKKTPTSARELFLKKKHGNVHPEMVVGYIPRHLVKIPKINTEDTYCDLTDKSTYSEYAWAFLRRNRFYQRFIDEGEHAFNFSDWGYLSSAESKPSYGLSKLKPYREGFFKNTPVQWSGIHTFRNRLISARPRLQGLLHVDHPETQVAIIFDINALLGDKTTTIKHQLSMAEKHLYGLIAAAGMPQQPIGTAPNKKLLRAELRIADLFSQPATITRAIDISNQHRVTLASDVDESDVDEFEDSTMSISHVATHYLPEFDIDRTAPTGEPDIGRLITGLGEKQIADISATRGQRVSRTSELAGKAWNNIYNWQFLKWLQYDDWDHLLRQRPTKFSEAWPPKITQP